MTAANTVSTVLLNYRDSRRSCACIDSALADGSDHVLVWDNSADGGMSATEIEAAYKQDARVFIHRSNRNLGFAAGANRAIEWCAQRFPDDWILLINNDATLLSGAIGAMKTGLLLQPLAKLAVPRINHNGIVSGRAYYQPITGTLHWTARSDCFSYPSGCCFLLAPERNELPLFDEDFFMYGEDWALGFRLSAPENICYLDEVLVLHEGSASSKIGSRFYEERMVAAHLTLVRKIAETKLQQILLTILRAASLTARAIVRTARYRSLVPLKALFWGARIAWWRDPLR
jgi:GT2 family glycosyltransferase